MFHAKYKRLLASFVAILLFTSAVFLPVLVHGQAYGSGSYDSCGYGASCPASSTSDNGVSSDDPGGSGGGILLNDFEEYLSAAGKELKLAGRQIVYFKLTRDGVSETHSVTISNVGNDFVDIVVASTPISDRIYITESKQYDVTNDSVNDIEIELKAITNGRATLVFTALSTFSQTPGSSGREAAAKTKSSTYLYLVLLIVGVGMFVYLIIRRKRSRPSDDLG